MIEEKAKLEFRLGQDDWETFAERLKLYFIAHDIPPEKQVAHLLTEVSADAYTLIRDLCSPVKTKGKSYAKL